MRSLFYVFFCSVLLFGNHIAAAQDEVVVSFIGNISKVTQLEGEPIRVSNRKGQLIRGKIIFDAALPGAATETESTVKFDLEASPATRFDLNFSGFNVSLHPKTSPSPEFEFYALTRSSTDGACELEVVYQHRSTERQENNFIQNSAIIFGRPQCQSAIKDRQLPTLIRPEFWPLRSVRVQYWEFGVLHELEAELNTSSYFQRQGRLGGRVFADLNENCSYDTGDIPMRQAIVEISPGPYETGPYFIPANAAGEIFNSLPFGTYSAKVLGLPDWANNCVAAEHTFTIDSEDETVPLNFPLQVAEPEMKAEVALFPGRAGTGAELTYTLFVENIGTLPFSGVLRFEHDERLTDFTSRPGANMYDAGLAEYRINNLAIGATHKILVKTTVPQAPQLADAQLCANLEISPAVAELEDADRRQAVRNCSKVGASVGTNSIQVFSGNLNADGPIARNEKVLTYLIRFENLGEDVSKRIYVRTTLDTRFKWETLRIGASSHECRIQLNPQGELLWRFDDIWLPARKQSRDSSQGFVQFSIELQDDLPPGTAIRNDAEIFFDFEKVLTNLVMTRIVESRPDSSDEQADNNQTIPADAFVLFPNPATDAVTIEIDKPGEARHNITTVSLSNVLGQTVLRENYAGTPAPHTLDLRSLPTGLFYLTIQTERQSTVKQIKIIR